MVSSLCSIIAPRHHLLGEQSAYAINLKQKQYGLDVKLFLSVGMAQ